MRWDFSLNFAIFYNNLSMWKNMQNLARARSTSPECWMYKAEAGFERTTNSSNKFASVVQISRLFLFIIFRRFDLWAQIAEYRIQMTWHLIHYFQAIRSFFGNRASASFPPARFKFGKTSGSRSSKQPRSESQKSPSLTQVLDNRLLKLKLIKKTISHL